MSYWENAGLATLGIIGSTLINGLEKRNTNLACSDQDRIEYLEKRIELLEAKLGKKAATEEYVNPNYPPGSWRSKFRPEDISHDGVYVRIEEGWVPVSSLSDIALKKRSG